MSEKKPSPINAKGAGHRARLRDKFASHGLSSFRDDEIIELLLTFSTPRKDCKEPARELLKRFGNLHRVLEAPLDELTETPGVGDTNAVSLKVIHEVARKFLESRLVDKTFVKDSSDVFDYLRHSMLEKDIEIFKVLYLDPSYSVIHTETIFDGTLTYNVIYLRELLRKSLKYNAAAIVIAHNHPSGNPEPSREDKDLTRDIVYATGLLEITLLDHVIVAEEGFYSFADRGLIEIYMREFHRNPAMTFFRDVEKANPGSWGRKKAAESSANNKD